jgi:EGF domain
MRASWLSLLVIVAAACGGASVPVAPDGSPDAGSAADRCQVDHGGCSPDARCRDDGGPAPTCTCEDGYTGDGLHCTEAVGVCAVDNGGCDPHATCTVVDGAASCACPTGYAGDGHACTPIDPCATDHGGCAADATCTNTAPGQRTCACNDGYTGDGATCTAAALCAAIPTASVPDIGTKCDKVIFGSKTCGAADSACAGNLCVTDNVEFREYCSTVCDPADHDACPSGFTCAATGCNTGPAAMCVRSESTAAKNTCTEYTAGSNWRSLWFGTLADGYQYQIALDLWNGGAELYGKPTGAIFWTSNVELPLSKTWTDAESGPVELTRVTGADASTYLALVTGVYRVHDGVSVQQTLGDAVTRVIGVFRTPSGAIRALVDEPALAMYERVDDATWTRLPAPAASILRIGALDDHGFVGVCASGPCAGDTGDDVAPVTVPAGVVIDELAQRKPLYAGASLVAYALVTRGAAVLTCHDHACTRDAMPAEYGRTTSDDLWRWSGFVHTGAATYLYLGHAEGGQQVMTTFRRDAGCWSWVSAPEKLMFQWGASDGAIHFDNGEKMCAVTP